MEQLVRFLLKHRWWLLAAALLLAAFAYGPAQRVSFDRSIERMFAPGDPLLEPYQRLKDKFGGNEIVLAVYADEQLLAADGEGIRRLADVSGRLKKVAGVRDVLSLAQIDALLAQLERTKSGALFNLLGGRDKRKPTWTGPAILNPESPLAQRFRELFAGYTHSADGRTAAVVCMLEPGAGAAANGDDPRAAALAALRTIIEEQPGGVLAGEPVMVAEGFKLLEADGRRLGTWSLWLLGLTILLCFRSLRWLVVPLVVVQWTLVVTRAVLATSGLQLSMVSSMLTAIVTVVGVASVMHLIVHYRELRVHGLAPYEALFKSAVLLAGPIAGAILTDASGFGALWWASVEPIRDFGTMMVIGSLLVAPAICLVVPALSLAGARDTGPAKPGWGEGRLGDFLMRSVDWIRHRPRTLAGLAIAVSLLASVGAIRLEVETDFTRNFRRGSPVVTAYEFVETRLGGAGVWDVMLPVPPELDAAYVARVRRLEEQLRGLTTVDSATGQKVPALTKVISLVDALDAVQADPLVARFTRQPEARAALLARLMPTFIDALHSIELDSHGQASLRIMLRSRERQPAAEKQRLIEAVTRLARAEFPRTEQSAGAEVTGFFVLLTNLIESVLRDQWTTFAVSTIAIAALVWIGFRSWKYALIALIPNAVPIYIVMGLLGWVGLKMNMGAAMIAAVSMGMSVDSSIHYFAAFRHARREGKTVHQALLVCQQSVGTAMIFTTLALIVGFGVLVTSEFVPTIYFGALMCLAMLGGMFGNLIVLPLLLSWVEREEPAGQYIRDAQSPRVV
ncbi:MAG: MMPL family transporter [Planctomycetaceae bacterium]|nr:MMPL family transporter [Planctomycetaceae bacterium]